MDIKKVLVIEDERMFREFLVTWLKGAGYTVLGAAGSLAEAERLSEGEKADLVLLDMDLPDGDGMAFVERQMKRDVSTRILVLTAHLGNYPVMRLRKSGVMGVLDKGATCGGELKRAFAAVGDWRTYYSDRVERQFRELVKEGTAFYRTLSPREEELLKLFGLGQSNQSIAGDLGLSIATVQGHRRNVMAKVGVKSTPELIIWAIQNGFVNGSQIGRMDPV
jgi:DNA-binding NarL/FixJ family response regulator